MKHPELTISVVAYKTDPGILSACLDSILQITRPFKCWVIDNSQDPITRQEFCDAEKRLPVWGELEYIPSENIGYGRAHNITIRKGLSNIDTRFHLAMNPDIHFRPGTIETLLKYMDDHQQPGLVMPKVLYPNGSPQKLCKLLPTPWHLWARRFFPWLVKKKDALYQLECADFDTPFECPSLSGCFMFLKTEALREIGLFDERFFMYFEDVDLVRRIAQQYKTMYCPLATVTHHYEKGSYSSIRLLLYHMVSGVKYFNKWGWWFDSWRKKINHKTLKQLKDSGRSGMPSNTGSI